MKHTAIVLPLVILAMMSCSSPTENKSVGEQPADSTTAAAPAQQEAAPAMDSATMAKMMMDYATPGEMHKMLASNAGKWDAEVTTMYEPGKPPQKSKGEVENKMIMGGRYQLSMHKGDMMGMPFEGMSITGYDNSKKVFVNSWIDNMGTGFMHLEGPYDAATKTMELKGKCTDPSTGKDCDVREVFKMIDDKNQYFEMYMTQGGQEMKMMEIKYTRKG